MDLRILLVTVKVPPLQPLGISSPTRGVSWSALEGTVGRDLKVLLLDMRPRRLGVRYHDDGSKKLNAHILLLSHMIL
jgi:hypothetical protein